MSDGYHIRIAQAGDLPALLLLEQGRFVTDHVSARSFRRWLHLRHDGLAVAMRSQQLLGYVLVLRRRNSRIARLYSIAVAPEAAGSGLGRGLLQWAERRAVQWQATSMRLEVQPGNAAALALYRRAGYQVIRAIPGYYEDGSDALRMEKRLAAA